MLSSKTSVRRARHRSRRSYIQISFLVFLCLISTLQLPLLSASDRNDDKASDKACGPPTYCARTDRRVEPYLKTPPQIGPQGSILTDPSFGSRIVRVSDERADPKGQGRPLMTPASAEQNSWNATSTAFYIVTMGGRFLLYDFDPATMKVHPRDSPNLMWRGEPQFSFKSPDVLYGTTEGRPEFQQYNISTGKLSSVNDPSKCLKLDAADGAFDVSVSADDNRFMSVIGPRQDDNYIVYVFDRDKGCRWYNTNTGEIGGQWGLTGKTSLAEHYGVHNGRISKSGKFVTIAYGAGPGRGKFRVWNVETLEVVVCPSQCSGHRALGYSHVVNSGGRHPMEWVKRPLDHLDSPVSLLPELSKSPGYWYDSHTSWNNADPDDTAPACLSTYRPSNPDSPATPLDTTGPWENEIVCVEMDGKDSKVWRFAHTFSTAKNGFWSTPRGNVSPDGKFFMFTSDWQDQLGKAPSGKYRTDVFIVELR